jgi:hypothetical protein
LCFQSKPVKWKKWENATVTGAKGTKISKKVLLEKEGTYRDLVSDFLADLEIWALHIFTANWQYAQYKELKAHLPCGWLLTVVDFAENYRCRYQDEITSAYYNYAQATVHPIQTFYHCTEEKCKEMISEACIFITDDLQHDMYAVSAFRSVLFTHLQNRGLEWHHHVQYSDGCSSQYKSKGPFHLVAESVVSEERTFFGSRHGKGPCDTIGGYVKSEASKFVANRHGLIRNAQEMAEFAKSLVIEPPHGSEKCHVRRSIFYIAKEDISRAKNKQDYKQVPNCRSLHSVKNDLGRKGQLLVRSFTCFCSACRTGEGECENLSCVGDWTAAWEKKEKRSGKTSKKSADTRKRQANSSSEKPRSGGKEQTITSENLHASRTEQDGISKKASTLRKVQEIGRASCRERV